MEHPPRPITPCSSPGCIEAPGGDGRPCQRRGSQARPWALRCPRAPSAHSPGSIRGSRTPSARPVGHTTWRGVPRAGRGAYNLAWHALSRPTPFSFATVNKTKFTRPPGHTMWIFQKKRFFGTSRKKVGTSPRECVFRNQRGRFSPLGVQIKGVIEKGLIFDEKY